jgi:hypothetical protein
MQAKSARPVIEARAIAAPPRADSAAAWSSVTAAPAQCPFLGRPVLTGSSWSSAAARVLASNAASARRPARTSSLFLATRFAPHGPDLERCDRIETGFGHREAAAHELRARRMGRLLRCGGGWLGRHLQNSITVLRSARLYVTRTERPNHGREITETAETRPYCGFKEDVWRFRALRVRCICGAVVAVAGLLAVGFGGGAGATASGSAAAVVGCARSCVDATRARMGPSSMEGGAFSSNGCLTKSTTAVRRVCAGLFKDVFRAGWKTHAIRGLRSTAKRLASLASQIVGE